MKVLIISHNPISTTNNNGKTMRTLFSSFNEEELCQLYITPTLPDVDVCKSYFRITDKDILKSFIKFKVDGQEVFYSEYNSTIKGQYETENDEKLYRNPKNKLPFRMLLRDVMWSLSKWYNKKLVNWIKEQNPTHIFLVPGPSKFLYNIALKVSKKFNLPIISYICDDYYFVKKPKTLLGQIHQRKLNKKIELLMSKTSKLITICDEINSEYSTYFNVPAVTVMTGNSIKIEDHPKNQREVKTIVYMGNIRCNRYTSLVDIGKILDLINSENKTDVQLKIFTAEKDESILKNFYGISSIKLCGFVSGEEYLKEFRTADIHLHVEAFDDESIDLVKHSISTKIADCLASGTCLFAYGPGQVASISYLKRYNVAHVCTDICKLKDALSNVIFNSNLREKCVINALNIARENHDIIKVGNRVFETISNI